MPEVSIGSAAPTAAGPGRAPGAILRLALWLTPLIFLRGSYDPAGLPKAAVLQVAALVALALWSARRLGVAAEDERVRVRWAQAPFDLPLAALLAWAAASLLWAQDPRRGLAVLMQWGAAAVVFVLLRALPLDAGALRRLLLGTFASGAAVAVLGLAQHAFGLSWIPQAYPPAATFANKNVAAGFVAAVLPFGLAGLAAGRSAAGWCAAGAAPMLAFVSVSLTRAAWAAVAAQWLAAAAFFAAASRGAARPLRRGLGAALALVALAGGLALAADPAARERLAAIGGAWSAVRDGTAAAREGTREATLPGSVVSLTARVAIWRNTLAMVREQPWGVGLGNHPVQYPRYARAAAVDPLFGAAKQLEAAHNDPLQLAAELGLPGFALLAWLAGALAVAWRRAFSQGAPWREPALLGAALAQLSLAVESLFAFPFQLPVPPVLLAVSLATLGRAVAPAGPQRTALLPREAARWLPRTAAALAVLLALLHAGALESDHRCFRMFAAERRGDWPRAIAEARAALQYAPGRVEPLFVLGEAALATGRPHEAVEPLEALLARTPHDINAQRNLAAAQAALGRPEASEALLRRALALDPLDAATHLRLGLVLQQQRRPAAARDAFRRAAEAEPSNAEYRYRLGVAALQSGAHGEARHALAEAVRLAPGRADAHKALGVLLLEVLHEEEGAVHLARALELDPGNRDAPRIRQILEARRSGSRSRKTPRAGDPGR